MSTNIDSGKTFGGSYLNLRERSSSINLTSEEAKQTISFFLPVLFLGKMLPIEIDGAFGVQVGRNPIEMFFSLKEKKIIYYLANNEIIYQGGNSIEFAHFLKELNLKHRPVLSNEIPQNEIPENEMTEIIVPQQ
ncbi:MAG: hypothetical protein Q4C95_03095 [Planctomycetia bacterium]|nr:hypothetical protein [Planctomycetia bacterium]